MKKAAAVAQPRAAPRKIPRLHITLRNVNTHDRVNTLRLYEKGRGRALVFNRKGKRKVDWLLRDTRSGRVRPPPDRLVNQLYQAQQHFDAPIHLISGYRGWARKTSRHFKGWAIDFRVEGVPTKTLWNFCKTFAKTGCGYYPTSGFVHMDLRDKAYTWIDVSGPGESAQYVKSDKAARSVPDANAVRADTPTEGADAPEGDDEGDDDYGRPAHWDFNRSGGLRKGDRVKWGGGIGTVVWTDEVSSHVKVEKPDGTVVDADGDYLKRA